MTSQLKHTNWNDCIFSSESCLIQLITCANIFVCLNNFSTRSMMRKSLLETSARRESLRLFHFDSQYAARCCLISQWNLNLLYFIGSNWWLFVDDKPWPPQYLAAFTASTFYQMAQEASSIVYLIARKLLESVEWDERW